MSSLKESREDLKGDRVAPARQNGGNMVVSQVGCRPNGLPLDLQILGTFPTPAQTCLQPTPSDDGKRTRYCPFGAILKTTFCGEPLPQHSLRLYNSALSP